MPRVFISHATADRQVVEREIIALLQRHGIDVWYSRTDISTAEEWDRSILRGLRDCDWFLIVLSPRSLDSEWVRSELHWALANRKGKVVPVLAEDCPVEEFDLRLPRIQSVDFRNPSEESSTRLLRLWNVERIPPSSDSPPPPLLIAPFDAATARRGQEQWAEHLRRTTDPNAQVEITNSIGMRLTLIPPGEYLRGSPDSDRAARTSEKPQHRVRITQPFYLGTVTVTQKDWMAVMGTRPWSGQEYTKEGSNCPATIVSWEDATEFCRKLAAKDGRSYRLPTEAEWEHACRAGTTSRYSFGDDPARLGDHAWFDGNTSGEPYAHAVGVKLANPFGLHDMHGNVWEWCADKCDDEKEYAKHVDTVAVDPRGPAGASLRVVRGGGWGHTPRDCRSANRDGDSPGDRGNDLGFRVLAVQSVG